jgi:hypothetical protein
MPFQMNRQQDVLHNILGLIGRLARARQTTPRRGPQNRRHRLEEASIGRIIAGQRLAHQAGPFVVTIAHARSHNAFRPIFQIVTPGTANHEFVTKMLTESDATSPGLPRFRPWLREDSHFPPRYRHGTRAPFCQGLANWGKCDMGYDGVRLASIGLAGLMMYLVDSPHPALGRGESDGQMTSSSSFGSAMSEPQGGRAAARAQTIMLAQAKAINQVVPANQMNDIDRAAANDVFRSRTTGANGAPTRRTAPIVAATDNSIWDMTSPAGKIFVIFGALLTIASALRMFIA